MDNIESLLHGFTIAVTLPHLALMLIGVLLGILARQSAAGWGSRRVGQRRRRS
jgi:hypothetical protein